MEPETKRVKLEEEQPKAPDEPSTVQQAADNVDKVDNKARSASSGAKQIYSTVFMLDDIEYRYKKRQAQIEEENGNVEIVVVNNDGSERSEVLLAGLKHLIHLQLPRMPEYYIVRLVFDLSHVSMVVVRKPMQVIGGITYKPFEVKRLAEIVFCAISSEVQDSGYGQHLMNHLKDYLRNKTNIQHILTCADNTAIGYFRKQGFSPEITLPRAQYVGYIKDYIGATLMQCSIVPNVRYLDAGKILVLQKIAIDKRIREMEPKTKVYQGLKAFKDGATHVDIKDIPGLAETGYNQELEVLQKRPNRHRHFVIIKHVLSELKRHTAAWPFLKPVLAKDAPDYYEVVKQPMDLQTAEEKLYRDEYSTMQAFVSDMRQIFKNCYLYNPRDSLYGKNAKKLEAAFEKLFEEIPEYESLIARNPEEG